MTMEGLTRTFSMPPSIAYLHLLNAHLLAKEGSRILDLEEAALTSGVAISDRLLPSYITCIYLPVLTVYNMLYTASLSYYTLCE